MQKKCNIVIRRSKAPRLLTSNMHIHVHICYIYSYIQRIYIYIYVCVYNAVFGCFRRLPFCLMNIYIIVGYRGKIPDGHSNPIYLVLKPLNLQNFWRIFDRPVSSMYCKYGEYACKLQTFCPLTINNVLIRGKHVISYYEYVEYAGIRPKNTLMISKTNMINKK